MNKRQKVVIIGHGYTSRLAVIRSVGQIGCEVTVIVMTGQKRFGRGLDTTKPIDCYSKYVDRYYFCHKKDEKGLVTLLLDKCIDPQQRVVIIPDSDFSAAVIDNNQERLKEHFLFPHINHTPGAVVEWMDKVKQKELAQKIGLNVASSCVVKINSYQYTIPESVKYPCFTKPLATITGGKELLKRCNNELELSTVLNRAGCLADNIQVLIEDYKEIYTEYAVLGFSDGNDVIIPGVIEITQMSQSHFGVARQGKVLLVEGFEQLIKRFQTLLKEIGFIGLFDIDFYKSNDSYYFGELNLRYGGSGYAITKMGVNLPGIFVKTLTGSEIGDMQVNVQQSATFVNERMCLDDWYHGYLTISEYNKMIHTVDFRFVYDNDDSGPQIILEHRMPGMKVKKILRKVRIW